MKITVARQELLDTVNKVRSIVAAKTALPIMSHILMEAEGSLLRVTSTDLKMSIECSMDCTVEEPGSLTVSCQRLHSVLSELPESEVHLSLLTNNVVELECNGILTRLYSLSPDEFPPMRSFEGIEALVFQQGVLKKLFMRTSFAICTDQSRYNLTGLLFQVHNGRLVVVATDGRRMSLAIEEEGIPSDAEIKVIIPSKVIHEMERLFGEEELVNVYIDESQAGFFFDNVRMFTSLIEGNFPNYEMVVPQKHDKEIICNTAKFMEVMRRTRTMTNNKFNSVRFKISSNAILFQVSTPEVGDYKEDMDIEYGGEDMEIAFNPDFILDVLRCVESDKVCLILKDGNSPGVIKPYTDAPLDTYVNVIMPIRL